MLNKVKSEIMDGISDALRREEIDAADLYDISDFINQLSKSERKLEGQKMRAQLRPGMAVRIKANAALRPRYILGVDATVVAVNRSKALIKLGDIGRQSGRFQSGDQVHCPLDALEIVEGE